MCVREREREREMQCWNEKDDGDHGMLLKKTDLRMFFFCSLYFGFGLFEKKRRMTYRFEKKLMQILFLLVTNCFW